ncbi:MAG: ORF6N domain-containing protein [Syntrophobacteraceae bacterium]|nr:ORF6N domain-containing protein [Syntrophobacteraceae bacterium]
MEEARIRSFILTVREQKVILASDLASLYGVSTKALNQAVKRNSNRFPADFVFQLTPEEAQTVLHTRSQTVTLKRGGNIKYLPYAFTEHGAIMAANVLNSQHAVQMSVFVVRAFVRMRGLMGDTRELAKRLAALEKELKERLDVHETAIVSILQRIMDIINPPLPPDPPPRKSIGFHAKERSAKYQVEGKGRKA